MFTRLSLVICNHHVHIPGVYVYPWLPYMFHVAGVLVASKSDLNLRRSVSEAKGREFAASKELEYFECSAVSGTTTHTDML